jgi:hypothetical protein
MTQDLRETGNIRLKIATELKRKRDAGQEVPGTEWLRKWTDDTLAALAEPSGKDRQD